MNLTFTNNRGIFLLCLLAGLLAVTDRTQAQDVLWGVTSAGGDYSNGTLFSVNRDGTNLQVAHSFGGPSQTDGAYPRNGLTEVNGVIYGSCSTGIFSSSGMLFSYDPATAVYTILHVFNNSQGGTPSGKLTYNPASGLLYGVAGGGANNTGVLFSIDPVTKTYTDLYDFPPANSNDDPNIIAGYSPLGTLTLYNNALYGITTGGGKKTKGVIFSFDLATHTCKSLYDFENDFVQRTITAAQAPFVVYNNKLYGTLDDEGRYNVGMLFSIDPSNNAFADLHDFNDSTDSHPTAVILYNNRIYGVTKGTDQTSVYFMPGDAYIDSSGVLFSYNPANNVYALEHKFRPGIEPQPVGPLVADNGKFLGVGVSNIYQYDPSGSIVTDLLDFSPYGPSPAQPGPIQLLLIPHTVGHTPQTISFSDLTRTYGDTAFAAGATTSSGLPLTYRSDNPLVATVSDSVITIVGAGTAHITVSQTGNATYDSASVTRTITVNPAALVIRAADTIRHQEQPNPVFRAIYSGLVNGDSPDSLTVLPTLTTTATQSSGQGTYPITAVGAVDSNYTITYQPGVLTVIGLLQNISFPDSVVIYGQPDVSLGSASSGLPVTYTSSDTAVATITASQKIHIAGAGSTVIITTQAGNATYAGTADTTTLRVLPADLTITADNKTRVYLQPDPVFTATYSGFVNGEDTSVLLSKPVFTSTASANSDTGIYQIIVEGASAANYTINYIPGTYHIISAGGTQRNSLETYFSSSADLQVNIYATVAQTAVIRVYNLNGRQLIHQEVSLSAGYNPFTLFAGDLPHGVYIVRVTGTRFQLIKTILKASK